MPPFRAGAHIDVQISTAWTRQYALYNAPSEAHRYLHRRVVPAGIAGGARALHERAQLGDLLEISAPKQNLALVPGAGHSLRLAEGIGITPIFSMVQQLSAAG